MYSFVLYLYGVNSLEVYFDGYFSFMIVIVSNWMVLIVYMNCEFFCFSKRDSFDVAVCISGTLGHWFVWIGNNFSLLVLHGVS